MVVAALVVLGLAVGAIQLTTWIRSPFHDAYHADVAAVAGSAPFQLATFVPIAVCGMVTAAVSGWLAARPSGRHDASRRPGLFLATLGSLLGVLAMGAYLARIGRAASAPELLVAGDRLSLLAGAMLGVSTVVLTLGPEVERRRHDALLEDDLSPLWRLLTQRFPTVRLPMYSEKFRLERRMIEIHDALALMPVGSDSQRIYPDDPLRLVAHAVLYPPPTGSGPCRRANGVLPRVSTPHEDLDQLRALAEALCEESVISACRAPRLRAACPAPRH